MLIFQKIFIYLLNARYLTKKLEVNRFSPMLQFYTTENTRKPSGGIKLENWSKMR